MVWSVLFIVAPLIFVVYYAFTDKDGAFTFDNILYACNTSYLIIFFRSISLAMIATVICLIIAYPLAYAISRSKVSSQKIMIMLVMLPMWMNFLIRTYSWMAILEDTGFINQLLVKLGLSPVHMINTSGAVILGMVYNFLPYMILPIYSVMVKIDHRLVEAAADLGCNNFRVLTKVIFPLSASGVISGVTMVFVPSISTFYISQKLGGGNFDLIGDTIERQFQNAVTYHTGAAISLVMMILILISLAVMNRFTDSQEDIVI